jgi:hypothetical protein
MNTSKIQKFIEKQKRRNQAQQAKKQASEQEKVLKVQQNLTSLHQFTLKERMKHSKEAADSTIK